MATAWVPSRSGITSVEPVQGARAAQHDTAIERRAIDARAPRAERSAHGLHDGGMTRSWRLQILRGVRRACALRARWGQGLLRFERRTAAIRCSGVVVVLELELARARLRGTKSGEPLPGLPAMAFEVSGLSKEFARRRDRSGDSALSSTPDRLCSTAERVRRDEQPEESPLGKSGTAAGLVIQFDGSSELVRLCRSRSEAGDDDAMDGGAGATRAVREAMSKAEAQARARRVSSAVVAPRRPRRFSFGRAEPRVLQPTGCPA